MKKIPSVIPITTGLVFLLTAILKITQGGHLCFDPWGPANGIMTPVEFALAYLLLRRSWREFGGLLGSATMVGAAVLLTWAHFKGFDIRACGCFGPIRMPYESHMAVIGSLFTGCFLTLSSRWPPQAYPDPQPLRRRRASH